jgi:mono/diheme cytochrome c family protein
MAAGEQGVIGGPVVQPHKPVVHDPSEFGCTTCHGGQGRATEKDEAHGDVHFWPAPMLPMRFAYAGCGSCHTHVRVPETESLQAGRRVFERADCLVCHRLDGRGGTIRPFAGSLEGPDLSRVGAVGYDPAWYDKHLAKARQAQPEAWRQSFAPLQEEDRRSLAVFLGARVAAPGLIEAKALFHSLGCRGCHKVNGVGGDDGPDLSRIGEKDPGRLDFTGAPGDPTLANWFAEHFRSPAKLVPGSLMPIMGLTEDEIDGLTFYVLSLRRSDFPEAYWPKDRIRAVRFDEREFSGEGRNLFGVFCAACHGSGGEGRRFPGMPSFPSITNPDFLRLASDEFIARTVRSGRPGARMPAWGEKQGGLRPDELDALVAYLRQVGGVAQEKDARPFRWAAGNRKEGERIYRVACSGCHGARGEGGEGAALNSPVLLSSASDTFLTETIGNGRRGTSMEGFRNPSSARPVLSQPEIEAVVTYIRSWKEK